MTQQQKQVSFTEPSSDQPSYAERFPAPKDFEEHMTWRIRWYLIITITIAYALSLIGGLVGFWITKDKYFLLFITPTVLIPFVKYLVPMDQRQYELKMAKINAKTQLEAISHKQHTNNKQVSI